MPFHKVYALRLTTIKQKRKALTIVVIPGLTYTFSTILLRKVCYMYITFPEMIRSLYAHKHPKKYNSDYMCTRYVSLVYVVFKMHYQYNRHSTPCIFPVWVSIVHDQQNGMQSTDYGHV